MIQYVLIKILKLKLMKTLKVRNYCFMGLFSFNYAKPGPGVDKDAPKKKGIFLYFELFVRKFFKMIQVNMLYFLVSIPYIILMFLFVTGIFGRYFGEQLTNIAKEAGIDDQSVGTMLLIFNAFVTMLIFSLWGSGPASAAYAYVTRCFTREEHAWILSDFFKNFKENFKHSMIILVLDFVILFLMFNAIVQYWNLYLSSNQFIWAILMYLCILAAIVYTFMHFYFYQIMVTFECKFKDLIKNALMLALGKAPMNLFLTVICFVLLMILFNFLHPVFAVFLCFILFYSIVRYPIEFYSARTIQRIAVELKED